MDDRKRHWTRAPLVAGVLALAIIVGGCIPVPPPGPGGAPSAGAAPLGTTSYPIPASGAYFVSPTGHDTDAGTLAAPWKTLSWAVANAPSGSTIVMRAGAYEESVNIVGKQLTIQAYPDEAVTLRGAKRVPTGTVTTVGTRTDWAVSWPYNLPVQRPDLLTAAHPYANLPEQVFVNGLPLRQVGDLASVDDSSFYVDNSAAMLYLGIDPSTVTVEASYLQTALRFINAAGSVLRGIQIEKYATPLGAIAPIQVQSPGMTVENVISTWGSAAGISVTAPNVELHDDTFSENGQLGVHALSADNLTLDSVLVTANNTEGFNVSSEAGGVKVSSSQGVIVHDSSFTQNAGNGLWFDVNTANSTIVHNALQDNDTIGLLVELSSGSVIAGNWASGNRSAGITITESSQIDIWNNTLADNGFDLQLIDWTRPQTINGVTIRNNVMYSSGLPQQLLIVRDYTNQLTAAQMNVTADDDAYCRVDPTFPTHMIAWAAGPILDLYDSVAQFTSATGNEVNGLACDGASADPMFADAPNHDWHPAAGSPLAQGGVPLAPNVAAALGQPAGATIGIGAG
jgi:parallel beta-helix repeat protein